MSADRPDVWTTAGPAMGGMARVTTDASSVAVAAATAVITRLDERWSRFRPDSELTALNTAGRPLRVRPSTARAIATALAARHATAGWFDPTRGRDLTAAGYVQSLTGDDACWAEPSPPPPRRDGTVRVDRSRAVVHVADDIALDLGGIGKGWAADAAATMLYEHGALYAGVEVGGDVRVKARTRAVVLVAHPTEPHRRPARLGLRDGGIAVSGPMRRSVGDGRHHLIDPHTGRPAADPRLAVVVAGSAAGAEVLATAAAIAPLPEAVAMVVSGGATAWLVAPDGAVTTAGSPERFLLAPGWLATARERVWAE